MTNLLCKLALKAAAEQVTYRHLWFFESFARTSQKSSPEEDPWHCALRAVFVGTRLVLGCPKSSHPAPLSDTRPWQPLRVLLAPARGHLPCASVPGALLPLVSASLASFFQEHNTQPSTQTRLSKAASVPHAPELLTVTRRIPSPAKVSR